MSTQGYIKQQEELPQVVQEEGVVAAGRKGVDVRLREHRRIGVRREFGPAQPESHHRIDHEILGQLAVVQIAGRKADEAHPVFGKERAESG